MNLSLWNFNWITTEQTAVTWNFRKITTFLHRVQQFLFKAMNRRGCRRAYTWTGFVEMLKYYPLAKPKTYYCLYWSECYYEEPYAGKPHVRICEGLRLRGLSLLDCRTDKIPLGTKGRTSILSVESSASCRASFPVSRRKLLDRACFVTSFRQGGYTPLRRLCVYPLWTCRPQTAWNAVRRQQGL